MKWIRLIYSFSKNKNKIIEDLQDSRSDRFYEHTLKIIVNPNNQEVGHWSDELCSFCSWIQRTLIKKDNKSIPKEMMMEYFFNFGETIELFSNELDNVYSDYNNGRERSDKTRDKELYSRYKQFCSTVADTLVNKKMNNTNMRSLVHKYLVN